MPHLGESGCSSRVMEIEETTTTQPQPQGYTIQIHQQIRRERGRCCRSNRSRYCRLAFDYEVFISIITLLWITAYQICKYFVFVI